MGATTMGFLKSSFNVSGHHNVENVFENNNENTWGILAMSDNLACGLNTKLTFIHKKTTHKNNHTTNIIFISFIRL